MHFVWRLGYIWRCVQLACVGIVAIAVLGQTLHAAVIYHDNYVTRPAHGSIIGQIPNIVNRGATGTYRLTEASVWNGDDLEYANVGNHGATGNGIGQTLETKTPGGTGSKTSFYLPYNVDLTGKRDILKLTFTFRKPAPANTRAFNNLIFGFVGTDAVNDAHLDAFFRFENGGLVRPFVLGSNTDASAFTLDSNANASSFNTVSIEYDPLKVSTQPWSITWNGVKSDFPKAANTTYTALPKMNGVGFGSFSSDTNQDRTAWLRDFKYEVIPQPLYGDLNGDGFVGQLDMNLVLARWGTSVTPGNLLHGDASGDGFIGQSDMNVVLSAWGQGTATISPVPEPATIVLMGLAGMGLAVMRFRVRQAG
ncbi:MAG: PEP-CTERM sorting domain-containing protein [Planctomycetota bacterium]|nr:PEP-CTERM sorting domain-containing protein [Planctomycetota bacterium]